MGFLSPPEGFNSWDEYDRFRKETGPSLRKSYPNKMTEAVATNPVFGLLVPGAEQFLQKGGEPSLLDIGLSAADVITPGLPLAAMVSKSASKLKPAKDVFHVTFSSKIPSIRKRGLRQFETSNWKKAGTGRRYNEDAGLFAWENPKDALYWAKKMEFEFPGEAISILRIKGGKHWGDDPAEEFTSGLVNLRGKSLRSMQMSVAPEEVLKEFTVSKIPGAGKMGISFDEWLDKISPLLEWSD